MPEAFIVAALRTAGGRKGSRLSGWHPADLAAQIIDGLLDRTGIDPVLVEDVVMGCVSQVGEQAANVARGAVLASRLPESTPATSVDRQCGSSQQALHFAAQAIMAGSMDVVIAAGVESMSRVPMFASNRLAVEAAVPQSTNPPMSPAMQRRYPGVVFSQFDGAEQLAVKYALDKDVLDAFAFESHQRAIRATQEGAFAEEILPVAVRLLDGDETGEMHVRDEGIRFDTSLDRIRGVKLLAEGGRVTAASASQICDGASGVMVVSGKALRQFGLVPLARIHHMSVLGHDPVIMLEAPIPATVHALKKSGMRMDEMDLYEVNEAFAPVPLAWLKAMDADAARLNRHGGAIALGHPLGASGTKLMTTLVHALGRTNQRYGLQTMCEAGGMANVTIVERL